MRRAERIIFAFRALGEAGQATAFAQRADTVAPPGEDLMRIALVAHIPDQLVVGRVEHVVDRDRELDHTKSRAQMPTRDRDCIDHFRAEFIRQLFQLITRKLPCIGGKCDLVQKRRIRHQFSFVLNTVIDLFTGLIP